MTDGALGLSVTSFNVADMYHPWRHLRSLGQGVTYSRGPTPGDKPAWWSPKSDHILMRPDLLQVERRCHLAHELAHRELKHSGECAAGDSMAIRKQERAADTVAAARLIDLERFIDAVCWSDEPDVIADHLWVTRHMLDVRVETMLTVERKHVRAELIRRAPEGGWGC